MKLAALTGDGMMLKLVHRLMRKTERPGRMWLDDHTVNFAERIRDGRTDPRQGVESCTWGEFTRSFNVVGDITGDAKWADRIEDVVFNHAPCSYTPDWREVHYITAPNQVSLDAPTTPWNYALDVKAPLEFRECAWTDDCFVASNAVCEITATGRRLPEWILQDGQPAALQPSPAYTTAASERLRFVPLGCQRCRLSVLPQATDDPEVGVRWKTPPAKTLRKNR